MKMIICIVIKEGRNLQSGTRKINRPKKEEKNKISFKKDKAKMNL